MDLINLKGIGPKTLKILNKIGINSDTDLITHYPFRYNILKKTDIDSLESDGYIVTDGIVESMPYLIHIGRRMDKMTFRLNVGTRIINVTIFNRGFYKSKLTIGTTITIMGKYDIKHNNCVAADIRFEKLPKIPTIEPIYHATYGLSSKELSKIIDLRLKSDIDVIDYVPDYLNNKYGFMEKEKAIRIAHHPMNINDLKKARQKLKYEELFIFMLKMNYLKNYKSKELGLKREVDYSKVLTFISNLPFKLTDDQTKAVEDIYKDLTGPNRMNRLLQGDVGSGKTIVSIISMYINYLAGYQSALMAPTEILAIQHYNNISKLFNGLDIKVELLTGKLKAKEKKIIVEKLKNNEIDIIIGTHALFSDDVAYNNLGLVITDEQHRFGVNQRASLKNKGVTPDILYMSATPIPRTYALTIYGDMDISSIKTMPSGRKEIITTLKKPSEIKDVLTSMDNELSLGHQIYVVAPLIEESDKIDLENVYEIESNMNKAFGKKYNIGVMHGKLSDIEKDEVMNKFKNNEIQILISTTVIEVGVDIPNATMMVIYDAFRFGLSALHQLRGRVGRNSIQSYCILLSSRETERLDILTKTTDGFKVAEEDFKLRGSGDLFGIRQSGDMQFNLADLKADFDILMKAKTDSEEFLSIDDDRYNYIKSLVIDSNNLD